MSDFKAKFYTNVNDIESKHWESLACGSNVYYTPEFLNAFEIANSDIEFNYILIFKNDEPVAFANTQIVTIGVETITKNIKISEGIKGFINRSLRNKHIRVLFCGNVFLSGEYGTFLKQGEDKITTFKAIAEAVKELSLNTKRLNAIFIKDFEDDSLFITNHLHDYDYSSMHVEPNMIIHLDPSWQNFDQFKNDLKSKYRVKANKADRDGALLVTKRFDKNDIIYFKKDLQELYENTIANANFNAQILNLNTYIHLKSQYGDHFIVQGYFLEDKLVGFLSAMQNQDHLDAHFIGLDYSLNKEYAIYPRILNDYVRIGIECKATQINLGRTASEIKSTLGAVPEELTCYIRHKRKFPNKLMKPFIKNVKIKSFKQHKPFKTKKETVNTVS
ncbi:MAG: hypothetical protein KJO41_02260 [Bacteroidia bacterium]|nr:hypothetical protein [Bacteroidia bacterium]NND26910.1 hypothetical protein [Flavobacteriaceae bacterium]MBT8277797.1 hypothetical protein [Bacteroidia bacterium]NNK61187.1 hypothetical protein [Flavobacteriaceae bacterium]NNL31788.1 hypothetical protein [Flavobacteriaceae bacterium]